MESKQSTLRVTRWKNLFKIDDVKVDHKITSKQILKPSIKFQDKNGDQLKNRIFIFNKENLHGLRFELQQKNCGIPEELEIYQNSLRIQKNNGTKAKSTRDIDQNLLPTNFELEPNEDSDKFTHHLILTDLDSDNLTVEEQKEEWIRYNLESIVETIKNSGLGFYIWTTPEIDGYFRNYNIDTSNLNIKSHKNIYKFICQNLFGVIIQEKKIKQKLCIEIPGKVIISYDSSKNTLIHEGKLTDTLEIISVDKKEKDESPRKIIFIIDELKDSGLLNTF